MLINLKAQAFGFSKALRNFSIKATTVKITEQKVKVGNYDINYVKSSFEGENPKKTLICLPGALGKKIRFDLTLRRLKASRHHFRISFN